MSTGHPVLKNFINGMWRPTGGSGGGGAGSTNPTEADATKVWQVTPVQKGTKTEETVIVSEQTLENWQDLEYNDKFVPGAQCVAVVNGVEYRGEVVEDKKGNYLFEAEFGAFGCESNKETLTFFNRTGSPEVTAKLSVIEETSIYDYNWAPGVKIPIPTAEDEGKILVVNEVEGDSKEYELAPTQTVTITEDYVVLQTSNLDKFVEGATVAVVINGMTYTEHVINDDVLCVDIDDGNWELGLIENGGEAILAFGGASGTYEVSVSVLGKEYSYEYQLQENSGGGVSSNILYCEGDAEHGTITAYIDSSELENPQITTIAVDTGEAISYFYRMGVDNWLVSGFSSFEDRNEWVKEWNTEGQYPTIYAYFFNK